MKKNRALLEAIEAGDVRRTRALLAEDPTRANLSDPGGSAPLLKALLAIDRRADVVEALLAAGADAKARDRDGSGALHYSITRGPWPDLETTKRVFQALVAGGAGLEQQGGYGWTPLMAAVMEGGPTDVEALVALGARVEVDFPDGALPAFTRGRTLLAEAVASPEALAILLRAGADPERKDGSGSTPVQVARRVLDETGTGAGSASFRAKVKRGIAMLEEAIGARATPAPKQGRGKRRSR